MFEKIFEKIMNLNNKIEKLISGGSQGDTLGAGFLLSKGNIWIVIAVAVLAVGGVAVLVIVKKKKKSAKKSGE